VRAALADTLAGLQAETALPRLREQLRDSDQRAIPAVLRALVKARAPDVATILLEHLGKPDPVVRMAAAAGLGELKPAGGAAALKAAYQAAQADALYVARAAILAALARYGGPDATEVLTLALSDKDWAVRVRALSLLAETDPAGADPAKIRPAPSNPALAPYEAPHLTNPTVTPHVFIDTARGTIQIELTVIDAPRTVDNFVTLARKGYFNGTPIHRVVSNFVVQDGDPRGDGEGGPGYTIRDEINQQPYLRGTVGMALDWRDTGGSQFFITHSPQPHLDARYTAFGRVLAGMDVVDRLQQWDVVERVRIWDGTTPMR
jgi:cyclophilin family peptidyl-prolyl cis-trans isomerase